MIVGTADDIADDFQLWLEQQGADGFNIMPAIMAEQLRKNDDALSCQPL